MLEKAEILEFCVIGQVQSKNEMPPNDQYKSYSTFVRLAGGALTVRGNGKASDLPADGQWAIFHLERSRSGSTPRIISWGWLNDIGGIDTNDPQVDVQWVKSLGAGGPSSGGGMVREAVRASANGK